MDGEGGGPGGAALFIDGLGADEGLHGLEVVGDLGEAVALGDPLGGIDGIGVEDDFFHRGGVA